MKIEPVAAVMDCMIELENWLEPLQSQASTDDAEDKSLNINIEIFHCPWNIR